MICIRCKRKKPSSQFAKSHSYCKVCQKHAAAKWYINNKQFANIRSKSRRVLLKFEVLAHYSGTSTPRCVCCGERKLEFLTLDHINGGGTQERAQHQHRSGCSMYARLRRLAYPKGYRTLCHNCNASFGQYGYCPHQCTDETMNALFKAIKKNNAFKRVRRVLSAPLAQEIRRKYATGKYTQSNLADLFDTSVSTIAHVVHNRIWVN